MLSVFFTALALLATVLQLFFKNDWRPPKSIEVLLSYLLLFLMGLMSLLAAYGHVFMGPEIAESIGWKPGSPFQYEIGMANLSYGILGVLSFRYRGRFWDASIIGWCVFLLGCFVGHVINYYETGNTAPYNIGMQIWVYDLIIPIVVLSLWGYLRISPRNDA